MTYRLAGTEVSKEDGFARIKGRPRRTAVVAASEKFRTVVIDMTVEAKQRLRAFKSADKGATLVCCGVGGTVTAISGRLDITRRNRGDSIS